LDPLPDHQLGIHGGRSHHPGSGGRDEGQGASRPKAIAPVWGLCAWANDIPRSAWKQLAAGRSSSEAAATKVSAPSWKRATDPKDWINSPCPRGITPVVPLLNTKIYAAVNITTNT